MKAKKKNSLNKIVKEKKFDQKKLQIIKKNGKAESKT